MTTTAQYDNGYQQLLNQEMVEAEKHSQKLAGWILTITIVIMNILAQAEYETSMANFLDLTRWLSLALIIWFMGTAYFISIGYYHPAFKYLNLILQVTTVTFYMLASARLIDINFAMSSTAPLFYLLVIGLTSFSLNPLLSLLAGIFAAVQFAGAFILWYAQDTLMPETDLPEHLWVQILLKSVLFIMMGVGTMFMARSSRRLLERVVKQVRVEEQIRFIEMDMEQAEAIQNKIIPGQALKAKHFLVETFYQPAKQVGGDYFDLIERPDGTYLLVMADVSGKGYAAAMMMSAIHAMVRTLSTQQIDVAEMVSVVNHVVINNSVQGKFVTLVIMELDTQRHRLRYINCGHNPPFLVSSNGVISALDQAEPVLGVIDNGSYQVHEISFNEHDLLFAYTDGLTEMRNQQGEQYGQNCIRQLLREQHGAPPLTIKRYIRQTIVDYLDGQEQLDDLSFVCLQFRPDAV